MTGNLLGASLSGLIGDFLGWRGVLAVLGSLAIVASVAVAMGFRGGALTQPPAKIDLAVLRHGYRTIFANPNARSATPRSSSKAAACSGCFPMSRRFCSNRA